MSKYIIEFTRHTASVIVEFDDKDRLINVVVEYGHMEEKHIQFLIKYFPTTMEQLERYRGFPNTRVSVVPEDVSFLRFWEEYKYKVGKKAKAERLWDALKEVERIKALKNIPIYNQWLAVHSSIEKKYPETYLSQSPWNN